MKAAFHHVLQTLVHFAFTPEKTLTVLHPFEIAHGDAPRIPKDIGDDKDSLFLDDGVRVRSGRAVGRLAENAAIHAARILGSNLIFGARRNQNVAWTEENFLC